MRARVLDHHPTTTFHTVSKRSSENSPSRDCLESPDGHQTGATQAGIEGPRERIFALQVSDLASWRPLQASFQTVSPRIRVNSPCATAIHVYAKNESVLEDLLDLLERTEDDVCNLLGVGDANRVGCALDLHDFASPGPLGHEAVERYGDVLVELPEHEPRRDRLPCRRPRALVERDVPHRPLTHGHESALLGGDVLRELLMVLLLADVEVGAAVGERDRPQRIAEGGAGKTTRELEGVLALLRGEASYVHECLDVLLVSDRIADDDAAVGVTDHDDGPLDGLQDAGDRLSVARDAAERVRRRDHRVALVLQAADHSVPTRGLGEGTVDENYGGPGSVLRVFAHDFLLFWGARSGAISPRSAV